MLDVYKAFVLPDPDEDRALLIDYYCKNFSRFENIEEVTKQLWSRRLQRSVSDTEVSEIISAFSSLANVLKEL